jgi:hypothetical protein
MERIGSIGSQRESGREKTSVQKTGGVFSGSGEAAKECELGIDQR